VVQDDPVVLNSFSLGSHVLLRSIVLKNIVDNNNFLITITFHSTTVDYLVGVLLSNNLEQLQDSIYLF
jgi:hypothetical protein